MTQSLPSTSERPYEPEFRAAQRARLVLEFAEAGEMQHAAEYGWVRLEGPWVHFYGDEQDFWQSWPARNVICVDWEKIDAPPF